MQIMYVCTGNQCRSVMAEYYTRAKLADRGIGLQNDNITVRSAGTLHYPPHPADPMVIDLLEQNPLAIRKVFLFNDFVNACKHMHAEGPIAGDTAADKLIEIMDCVPMLRPFLPTALETEDPHRQSREVFERVYAEIKHGVDIMLGAVA